MALVSTNNRTHTVVLAIHAIYDAYMFDSVSVNVGRLFGSSLRGSVSEWSSLQV